MRLKTVSVVNFKSYKGGTTVQLEDGKTFLVGLNGSGKSNFFQAITFILGSRNTILGQLARMHYFNNGRHDVKLTVEVVLEDELGKLPGDIKITRRIGVRSDGFLLCGRKITRKELSFVLEICGFSLSTPYYILTHSLMKVLVVPNPKNRLKAFVECIGLCISRTVTFLDEKQASMEELKTHIQEFKALLDRYHPTDVDAAAAKLREYKKLIKNRALLKVKQYTVSLAKYENLVKEESESLSRKHERDHLHARELHALKCQITTTKVSVEKCKHDLASSQLALGDLEAERETLIRNTTRLSLKIRDTEELLSLEERDISEDPHSSRSDSDSSLTKKIELEKRFEELSSKFAREKSEVEALRRQLNEKKQAHHELLLKRAFHDKFSSTEERQEWINNEVRKQSKKYGENLAAIKSCDSNLEEYKKALADCENEIKLFDQESKMMRDVMKEQGEVKQKISELHNELNELRRHENFAANELETQMKNLNVRKNELILKVGRSAVNGLESVQKVIASMDPPERDGCYGAILQNFTCDPSLNLAIDAAAGSRLLAQIVNTDTLGTAIMRKINSLDLPGEVVFFPVNRIIPPMIPSSPRDDAVPLINHLQFPEAVRSVMVFLFGRVMLCRDLEVAAQVARELGCSCVTMEGDRVTQSGPLTGGFIDPKRATRALFSEFQSVETSQRNQIISLGRLKDEVDRKKSAIDAAMAQLQQLEMKIRSVASGSYRRVLTQKMESLKAEENQCSEQREQLHSDNKSLLRNRQMLLEAAQDQEVESAEEDARILEVLNGEIFEMTKAVNDRGLSMASLESQLSKIAQELASSQAAVALKATNVEKLKILRQKLADLKTRSQLVRARLAAVEGEISATSATVNAHQVKVRKLESELDEMRKKLRQADAFDGGLNESVVREKIANLRQKVEEIGRLREQEMNCHKIKKIDEPVQLSLVEIRERLKRLNESIAGMESAPLVSAAAVKRHRNFLRIKEKCTVWEREFTAFNVTLREILLWIQLHIRRYLENIVELYNHYFSMMADGGSGSMVLESFENNSGKAVPFSGISISTRFSGGLSLSQMQLLSEGQRVIVLLSIVFAFVKRNGIGFCIMDEIDQALSVTHIRGMLQAMSEFQPFQFLISSHNKNMIAMGDHYYILEFRKSSSIKPASRSDVMRLMEGFSHQSRKPSTSLFTSSVCSQQSDSSQISTHSSSA